MPTEMQAAAKGCFAVMREREKDRDFSCHLVQKALIASSQRLSHKNSGRFSNAVQPAQRPAEA